MHRYSQIFVDIHTYSSITYVWSKIIQSLSLLFPTHNHIMMFGYAATLATSLVAGIYYRNFGDTYLQHGGFLRAAEQRHASTCDDLASW